MGFHANYASTKSNMAYGHIRQALEITKEFPNPKTKFETIYGKRIPKPKKTCRTRMSRDQKNYSN